VIGFRKAPATPARPQPEARTILIDGEETPYTLKRSARRRTIAFQVSEDGLTVFAPVRAATGTIEAAILSRQAWISAKLAEWGERPSVPQIRFEDGDQLMFRGAPLTLRVTDLDKGVRTKLTQAGDEICVQVDPQAAGTLRTVAVRGAVTRWYRREADAHLAPRVHLHAQALGRRVSRVIIRDQKRRWGSCDPAGVIRLNWRLIMMPDALSDYVCAHEAAHLVEANHSPAYWAVVERLVPDWKARRKALNDTARTLPAF
tara:strand:- start:1000 stop:1776 length:777 start_codon:yes stop_codon:yes gene_type:complete